MPPGAAKLPIGGELEPDLLLLCDHPFDLAVFNRAQRLSSDLIALALEARLFQRWRPQQTPHMIGAEWRRGARHGFPPGCQTSAFPLFLVLGKALAASGT